MSSPPGADPRTDPKGDAVVFAQVVKRYGALLALDRASFSLRRGETVALLGPNGAGKSTTLGVLLGLRRPDQGSASVFGADPRVAVRQGRVGAMLQSTGARSGLPPRAKVRDLLLFAARLYAHPAPVAEVLEEVGLSKLADRSSERLSGGEAQRLRYAMARIGNPELAFLDEPTVAMDVEARRAFWASVRRFASAGRTVLFATHYLEEADAVADRIVVLFGGRVIASGPPSQIRGLVRTKIVRFTLAAPDRELLARLPGVDAVELRGTDVSLRCVDADLTVPALYGCGLVIQDIQVIGAGLEEAFLHLTSDAGVADRTP